MARIPTSVKRRLPRLRRRRQREIQAPTSVRSTTPFRYDASFRIAGVGKFHEEISLMTGIAATKSHKSGDVRRFGSKRVWLQDLWILDSPLGEEASLDDHLQWLWNTIEPHKSYFASLISRATWADVCVGCLSESAYPVLSASSASLSMIREINLSLSFNFTCV